MQHSEYQQQIRDHLRQAYLLSEDRIDEVMPGFMATLKSMMQDLEQLSRKQNIEAINKTGHALKGALLNLGLHDIADIAYCIEKFKSFESEETELAEYIDRLREEMDKIY